MTLMEPDTTVEYNVDTASFMLRISSPVCRFWWSE